MNRKLVGFCLLAGVTGGSAYVYQQDKSLFGLLRRRNVVNSDSVQAQENVPKLDAVNLAFYRKVVKDFQPSLFQTDDWFTANCHFQTIVGSGALSGKIFGNPTRPFTTIPRRIETPDNDFFDIEYCNDISQSDDLVIILHGLEGNSKSAYVTNTAKALLDKGFSCILFNFRGCSGELNRTPGAYHVGFTQDLRLLVNMLRKEFPEKRFYFTGTSLGGNVILKYLGELGEEAKTQMNIEGAAVACVPFDPKRCQSKIDVGWNRLLYSENFLATLKRKAETQYQRFPGSFDIEGVRKATTVGDFDDAYIAKLYNFADKFDYYEKNGSIRFLRRIRVPTIAFNAIDDPFIESGSLPTEAEHVGEEAPVRLIYHANGGHCGFYTSRILLPKSKVVSSSTDTEKAISEVLDTTNYKQEYDVQPVPKHGWLAEEAARCLDHIRQMRQPSSTTEKISAK